MVNSFRLHPSCWDCVLYNYSFIYVTRAAMCRSSTNNPLSTHTEQSNRVSYRGGLEFPPQPQFPPSHNSLPPQKSWNWVWSLLWCHQYYMLLDISMWMLFGKFVPDCNLRGSKFKIFLGRVGGMSPDPPSRHAHVREFHTLLSSCFLPPPPMYETLSKVATWTRTWKKKKLILKGDKIIHGFFFSNISFYKN